MTTSPVLRLTVARQFSGSFGEGGPEWSSRTTKTLSCGARGSGSASAKRSRAEEGGGASGVRALGAEAETLAPLPSSDTFWT